ncbi:MAG: hypothetical protein U0892_22245 [Pirellulales bacterium]
MKPDSKGADRSETVLPAATDGSGQSVSAEAAPARSLPKTLWFLAILYALWLAFLAYVAWVNVQAGNQ